MKVEYVNLDEEQMSVGDLVVDDGDREYIVVRIDVVHSPHQVGVLELATMTLEDTFYNLEEVEKFFRLKAKHKYLTLCVD